MKTKSIISLCLKSKKMAVFSDKDRKAQWLSSGDAMYLIDGLPEVTTEILCVMYDISDKNKEKMLLRDSVFDLTHISIKDVADNEFSACPMDISLKVGANILIPFETELGVFFINSEYLKPFADSKYETLVFTLRPSETKNEYYIAVKRGLLLEGIITPIKTTDDFVNKLGEIWNLSSTALKNTKEKENGTE